MNPTQVNISGVRGQAKASRQQAEASRRGEGRAPPQIVIVHPVTYWEQLKRSLTHACSRREFARRAIDATREVDARFDEVQVAVRQRPLQRPTFLKTSIPCTIGARQKQLQTAVAIDVPHA